MSDMALHRHGRWAGLVPIQLLALAFLAGGLSWVLYELEIILPNDRITASLSVAKALGSTLGWQLAAFCCALVFSHALLGFFAYALDRLTEAAFPIRSIARHEWLVAGWFALLVGLVMAANTTWNPASMFASEASWWRSTVIGPYPVQLIVAGLSLVLLSLAVRAAPRLRLRNPMPTVAAVSFTMLALVASLTLPIMLNASAPAVPGAAPMS